MTTTTTTPLEDFHPSQARTRVFAAGAVLAVLVTAVALFAATGDDDSPAGTPAVETPAAVVPHEDPLITRYGSPAADPHDYPRGDGAARPAQIHDPLVTRFGQRQP